MPDVQLPAYIGTKQIWALRIASVGDASIAPEGALYAPVDVGADWIARHQPKAGGYLVFYPDGYRSYSPREAFEGAYERLDAMTFGHALEIAKAGQRISRKGWNARGQFVALMPELQLPPYNTQGAERKVNDRTARWIGEDQPLDCRPYFALYNAQKQWQPGWVPSMGDLFAGDWQVGPS